MRPLSDEKIIEGIINKQPEVIHFMYKDYFPLILVMIEKHSGTLEDAQDVFQDGQMALFLRCRDKELILNCALRTYFYSICRHIWLQRLEKKQRMLYQPDLLVNENSEKYITRESITKEQKLERNRLFWKHFKELPDDCQNVLLMYFDKVPFRVVAEKLGFTDENYAKVRKYLCKKLLRKRIKQDPDFINCIGYE